MKRVKKGFVAEFYDTLSAHKLRLAEDGGELCVSICDKAGKIRHVTMSPEQCESAGIIGVTEDVPEQWECMRDAWIQAWDEAYGEDAPHTECATVWQRMVEILGPKPEDP